MAREHLEQRDNWQGEASERGRKAEDVFDEIIRHHLRGSAIEADFQPMDLAGVYGTRRSGRPHGLRPECAIRNTRTGRTVFVEIKRQRAAGNAHERACKYLAPGILAAMREVGRQPANVVPMWWIFTNGIARDPDYRQEISFWFRGLEPNLLLWDDLDDHAMLINHFEASIRPMLE